MEENNTFLPYFCRLWCFATCRIFLEGHDVVETNWLKFVLWQTYLQCWLWAGHWAAHRKHTNWMGLGWFELSACALARWFCIVAGLCICRDRTDRGPVNITRSACNIDRLGLTKRNLPALLQYSSPGSRIQFSPCKWTFSPKDGHASLSLSLFSFLPSPHFSSWLHFVQDSTGLCSTMITMGPIANCEQTWVVLNLVKRY